MNIIDNITNLSNLRQICIGFTTAQSTRIYGSKRRLHVSEYFENASSFLSVSGSRLHVDGVFGYQKRSLPKMLSTVDPFDNAVLRVHG